MVRPDTCCTLVPYFKVADGQLAAFSEITRLEVHAPAAEVAKLREPMAGLKPKFFELASGIRR